MISGAGIQILIKRPTPRESENKNFCIPSDRNTQPTMNLINRNAAGFFSNPSKRDVRKGISLVLHEDEMKAPIEPSTENGRKKFNANIRRENWQTR
jgi:hypothetical protein